MTDIWSERIQELILSGTDENIILACGLVEDKMALRCWVWTDKITADQLELPFIPMYVAQKVGKQIGYQNLEGLIQIEYLTSLYENRHMEQNNSGAGAEE